LHLEHTEQCLSCDMHGAAGEGRPRQRSAVIGV